MFGDKRRQGDAKTLCEVSDLLSVKCYCRFLRIAAVRRKGADDLVYESMTCPRKAIMPSPVNVKKKNRLYVPNAFIADESFVDCKYCNDILHMQVKCSFSFGTIVFYMAYWAWWVLENDAPSAVWLKRHRHDLCAVIAVYCAVFCRCRVRR